jgi:hypothetical protein
MPSRVLSKPVDGEAAGEIEIYNLSSALDI